MTTVNGVGLLLAALNIWTYPRRYTGAFVLGNLLFAILMRNELFGRILYMFVNKAFAKVRLLVIRKKTHADSFCISGHRSGSA